MSDFAKAAIFTQVRFGEPRLKDLGLQPTPKQIESLKKMDCVDQIALLKQIGETVVKEQFDIGVRNRRKN